MTAAPPDGATGEAGRRDGWHRPLPSPRVSPRISLRPTARLRGSAGWVSLCAVVAAAWAAAPVAPRAQDAGLAYPRLTFNLSERLEADSNPLLASDDDPNDSDGRVQAATDVSARYEDATPISRLSFSASATARAAAGEGAGEDSTFDGPVLRFAYNRAVRDSSLALRASARRERVEFLRGIDDLLDDGTGLPDDFEDLEGEGTRQSVNLDAVLTLRDDAPFGLTVSADLEAVDYQDVTSDDLTDYNRARLGLDARFQITPIIEATAGLRGAFYDDGDDPDDDEDDLDDGLRDTYGLVLGAAIDRQDGRLFGSLSLDDTEDGLRTSLSFGRSLTQRAGTLSGDLGVSREATGDLTIIGGLDVGRAFRNGSASLSLDRSVRAGDDDEEEQTTVLVAQLDRSLTATTALSLDALLKDAQDTGNDTGDLSTEFGATLSRSLSRDWSVDVGYRHRLHDDDDEDVAQSHSVFLTVGRSFVTRF